MCSGLLTLGLIVIPATRKRGEANAGILKKAGEEKIGEEIDFCLLASTPSGSYASKTPAGVLSN
jgi:hypothetical protein